MVRTHNFRGCQHWDPLLGDWVRFMTRHRYTALQNAAFFLEHGGICHLCGSKIDAVREKWEREHVIPLAMGGADEPSNQRPAHKSCHRAKTDKDLNELARAKRRQANHLGARPKGTIRSRGFGAWEDNTKRLEEL